MARKRRRAKGNKKDSDVLTIADQDESSEQTEIAVEKPAEIIQKKEASAVKTAIAKPAATRTVVKKGPSAWQRMGNFLKDVRAEMKKVSWPDKERTTQSTAVVVFTLILLSAVMGLFTFFCTRIVAYFFG